ncbi:transmembrane protein 45B-like [Gigantopelta aegis]|uniref:transmembrane protein 45B-like n=1 Tax=Gigantopelta aegis TaxID=1735272 RepID=UPI001B88D480|nr:transmembrane protein 45B-like [Gigantopelta aegis]XP_041351823.1 transmembrane protein 45B-like [Gigantopelta aegis]XP_041351824.1 transmembrane protein 45B-like [Gigantopelta aegis]
MGNFGGHALPGSFFLIFAIWYTVNIFRKYYICRQRNQRFTSCIAYPCFCLCGRLKEFPLEGCCKILLISVGLFLEIYTGMRNGQFVAIGNGQHATMFFFFGLTGIMDILVHYRAPLPPDVDYISNILAFAVEGLLFKFHLHGRTDLDVLLHTFLLYIIAASVFSLLLEMRFRHNVLATLARAYLFFLQGTWFWHVGYILYNPVSSAGRWDEENKEQMMLATLYFSWHVGAVFVFMLLIGAVIACLYRNGTMVSDEDDIAMKRLIHTGANGQTLVSLNDDTDSDVDIEFEKPVSK